MKYKPEQVKKYNQYLKLLHLSSVPINTGCQKSKQSRNLNQLNKLNKIIIKALTLEAFTLKFRIDLLI